MDTQVSLTPAVVDASVLGPLLESVAEAETRKRPLTYSNPKLDLSDYQAIASILRLRGCLVNLLTQARWHEGSAAKATYPRLFIRFDA